MFDVDPSVLRYDIIGILLVVIAGVIVLVRYVLNWVFERNKELIDLITQELDRAHQERETSARAQAENASAWVGAVKDYVAAYTAVRDAMVQIHQAQDEQLTILRRMNGKENKQ